MNTKFYDIVNATTGAAVDGPFRSLEAAAAQCRVMNNKFLVAVERGYSPRDSRWLADYQKQHLTF